MTMRRGPVAADAAEFAAMIESIILRWVSSASFTFASESRSFAAATRLVTASVILIESARLNTSFGAGAGAVVAFAFALAFAAESTDVTGGTGGIVTALLGDGRFDPDPLEPFVRVTA